MIWTCDAISRPSCFVFVFIENQGERRIAAQTKKAPEGAFS
jgi:hypothetical protein